MGAVPAHQAAGRCVSILAKMLVRNTKRSTHMRMARPQGHHAMTDAADYEESCHRLASELKEARAEIERLTAENADLRRWKALDKPLTAAMAVVVTDMQRLRAEIERLKAEGDNAMTDERNALNEALVKHCGAKAQAEFALMAMASSPNDVLWQAIAATVIDEALRFLRDALKKPALPTAADMRGILRPKP